MAARFFARAVGAGILCIVWASQVSSQCPFPGMTFLDYYSDVVRTGGNEVWTYAKSWLRGPCASYSSRKVTASVFLNGIQIHGPASRVANSCTVTVSWVDAPSVTGLGIYRIDSFHEAWLPGGSPPYASVSRTVSRLVERPTISGVNAFWWLGGSGDYANGYYDYTQLTADPKGAPEVPYWTVTANPQKVRLSCSVCYSNTVTSLQPSGFLPGGACVSDIMVKVSVGGLDSNEFGLFVNAPLYLAPRGIDDWPYFDGWRSQIWYSIIDMCNNQLPSIAYNEKFGAFVNDQDNNWAKPTAAGLGSYPGYEWFDDMFFYDCQLPQCRPPVQNPRSYPPPDDGAVDHASQEWRVGTSQVGFGVWVQTNIHQRYIDHGRHR